MHEISKSFGLQVLFDKVSFKLNSKERVGVVGRNGHGKTTLFKIICGEDHPDDGKLIIPKDYSIGYVKQIISFSKSIVLDEAMLALPHDQQNETWKAKKILSGLGFSNELIQTNPENLSSGFSIRLNLAKALLKEPKLLLLDEPNNFLDITSIRWLSLFLKNWPNELMLITHDRSFMDSIVTHTLGIHRSKFRKIQGNTEKLYNQLAHEEEIYEKTRQNDNRKQKEMELFINKFRAKARLAGMVQSRIKTLNKIEKKEKLEEIKNLDFNFSYKPILSKTVLSSEKMNFSYDKSSSIIQNLSLSIGSKDRICVIGKNGKGKTTLLKLLTGDLKLQEGTLTIHDNVDMGYYSQDHIYDLSPNRTVYDEILSAHPELLPQKARNICGTLMFTKDDALKKIDVLSGGEKSRVLLGKIIASPCSFLLLDEPTNHLDMYSTDALLEALDSFNGAVVLVTHNEMILHEFAQKLIVFHNNRIEFFDGTYARFLETEGWEDEKEDNQTTSSKSPNSKRELRQKRSEIISRRSKDINPIKNSVKAIEKRIETYESEIKHLKNELITASSEQNAKKIAAFSKNLHILEKKVEALFDEYTNKSEQLETLIQNYDKELNNIKLD